MRLCLAAVAVLAIALWGCGPRPAPEPPPNMPEPPPNQEQATNDADSAVDENAEAENADEGGEAAQQDKIDVGGGTERATSEPRELHESEVLGADDFGGTFSVKMSQMPEIVLRANETTAYRWECSWKPENRIKLVSDNYVPDPNPDQAAGAGGTQHYRVSFTEPGEVTVLVREGVPGMPDAVSESGTFTFIVQAPR